MDFQLRQPSLFGVNWRSCMNIVYEPQNLLTCTWIFHALFSEHARCCHKCNAFGIGSGIETLNGLFTQTAGKVSPDSAGHQQHPQATLGWPKRNATMQKAMQSYAKRKAPFPRSPVRRNWIRGGLGGSRKTVRRTALLSNDLCQIHAPWLIISTWIFHALFSEHARCCHKCNAFGIGSGIETLNGLFTQTAGKVSPDSAGHQQHPQATLGWPKRNATMQKAMQSYAKRKAPFHGYLTGEAEFLPWWTQGQCSQSSMSPLQRCKLQRSKCSYRVLQVYTGSGATGPTSFKQGTFHTLKFEEVIRGTPTPQWVHCIQSCELKVPD